MADSGNDGRIPVQNCGRNLIKRPTGRYVRKCAVEIK